MPTPPDAMFVQSLSRVAHDVRGAAGVTASALDELERSLGPQGAEQNAKMLRLARCGLARLEKIADRCEVIAELANASGRSECDAGEIAARAMADAAFAYGRRAVRVLELEGRARGLFDARTVRAGVSDATMLALLVARSEVRGRVEEVGDLVRVSIEADAESSLAETWEKRGWERPDGARDQHVLAMRLLDGVARHHGGAAKIASREGKTTITIELKRADVPQRTTSVLVVDDDDDLAMLIEMGLSRHGHRITVARTCKEALDVATQETFDAIVTDQSLPDGTGADLIRGLATRPRAVIIVSGFEADSTVGREANASADVFMCKPIDIDILAERLETMLGA